MDSSTEHICASIIDGFEVATSIRKDLSNPVLKISGEISVKHSMDSRAVIGMLCICDELVVLRIRTLLACVTLLGESKIRAQTISFSP